MSTEAGKSSWLSAIRGLRDNPLPALWQLQEARRMQGRSHWLASPGLLIMALLLSGLTCTILIRQLLLLSKLTTQGAGPYFISSARWISFSSIVMFIGILCLLWAFTRLFQALQFASGLLGAAGQGRHWTLEDGVQVTELDSTEIVTALLWHNLRSLLPSLIALSLCFTAVAGVYLVDMLHDSGLAGFQWQYLLLPVLPLAFLLNASLATLILNCLGLCLSSPGQQASLPTFYAGNVLLLQLGLLYLQLNQPVWQAENYLIIYSGTENSVALKILTLLLALVVPACIVLLLILLSRWTAGRSIAAYALLPVQFIGMVLAFALLFTGGRAFAELSLTASGPFAFTVSSWSLLPLYLLYPLFSSAGEPDTLLSLPYLSQLIWPLQVLLLLATLHMFANQAARHIQQRLR